MLLYHLVFPPWTGTGVQFGCLRIYARRFVLMTVRLYTGLTLVSPKKKEEIN